MLYNGEKKWTAPVDFGNLVEKSIPEIYIPAFKYYKIVENELPKETLLGIKNVLSAIFYLENSGMKDVSGEIKHIVSLIEKERPEELRLFRKWIKHFFYGSDEISDEIANSIIEIEEVKDMLSTTLKKRDKVQFEQGKLEGKLETARNLLNKKTSVKEIAEITGLAVEEIEKLKK